MSSASTSVAAARKVVLLGASGVGKTTLFRALQRCWRCDERTLDMLAGDCASLSPTISVDFVTFAQPHVHLWDTAGQERYAPLPSVVARRTAVFVLVYDASRRDTWRALDALYCTNVESCAQALVMVVATHMDHYGTAWPPLDTDRLYAAHTWRAHTFCCTAHRVSNTLRNLSLAIESVSRATTIHNIGNVDTHRNTMLRCAPTREIRVREPLYVRNTRLMIEPLGIAVRAMYFEAKITVNNSDDAPRVVEVCADHASPSIVRNAQRLVVLSIRITDQDARTMPFDLAFRPLVAMRPYIVRRNYAGASVDTELVEPGVAYANDVCNIALCSMHAIDFDATAVNQWLPDDDNDNSSPVHVPKTYPYGELLRQVTMANQLECMQRLARACATEDSMFDAPVETSDAWRYEQAGLVRCAADITESLLVPATRRTLEKPFHFRIAPVNDETWAQTLAKHPHQPTYRATIHFIVFVACVNDK